MDTGPLRRLAAVVAVLVVASTGLAESSVEALLEAVRSARGRDRVIAVRALEDHDDPRVVEALVPLTTDRWIALRMAASRTLGTIGGDAAVRALGHVARTDESGTVRGIALRALGRTRDPGSFDLLVASLDVQGARTGAIEGLGLLGDPRGYEAVLRVYVERDDDPYVYEAAPRALVALDRERAVLVLLGRFLRCSAGERVSVAAALGAAPDPRVLPALRPALAHDDPSVRRNAVHAIAGAAGDAALGPLVAHGEARADDRAFVARELPGLGGILAESTLLRWFDAAAAAAAAESGGDDRLAAACAHGLGRLGAKRAVEPLARSLRHTPRATRTTVRALEALAVLGDRRACADVAALLDDETSFAQPREISAIWGFPHNVRISAVAAWSLLTLRDGRQPCNVAALSEFRGAGIPAALEAAARDVREWWDARGGDPALRID